MTGIWPKIKKIKLKSRTKLLMALVLCITVIPWFSFEALEYIEQPGFCSKCHSMTPHFSSWAKSGHSQVNCYNCHGDTKLKLQMDDAAKVGEKYTLSRDILTTNKAVKVFGKIIDWMSGYAEVISDYTDKKNKQLTFLFDMYTDTSDDVNKQRSWNSCVNCHEGFLFSRTGNDHYGHFKHTGSGVITCRQCHGNLVHEQKAEISREACLNCHDKEIPKPPSHVPDSFKLSHGKDYLTEKNCSLCHVQGIQEPICQDCHKLAMPHPENYREGHIPAIAETGVRTCFNCHQEDFDEQPSESAQPSASNPLDRASCSVCHGVKMPHTGDVLKEHTGLAKRSGLKSCSYCHQTSPGQKDMAVACTDCHGMEVPHPQGFQYKHKEVVAAKGQGVCSYCHSPKNPINPGAPWASPKFCLDCHMKNKPHDPGFKAEHQLGFYDRNRCSTCHPTENHCYECHFGE
ncbi:cytochrome c3 family protein [Phosphitispora fastidiosa]|uniref:cytochrome c3 family protein n=1 Tax=Phosphitispora fastidiosa TaxID=2837202 RepID=UPI001E3EC7B1|nr:cytochrome c3 family protein [Phosphitispora fastidiosa]MBU7005109.1 nitrate/TMAO reductase-like tetraheme cytochrome c subunit [Phosphitispora fastidiosa]